MAMPAYEWKHGSYFVCFAISNNKKHIKNFGFCLVIAFKNIYEKIVFENSFLKLFSSFYRTKIYLET